MHREQPLRDQVRDEEIDRIGTIIAMVARYYTKRCWWVKEDDLRQVGWVAALEALPNFDQAVGTPLTGYVYRAAVFAMKRWCWGESAPTSGGWHRPEKQRRAQRAPLFDHTITTSATAEEVLDTRRWRRQVRQRLHEIADPLTVRVLLEDETAAEAAARAEVTPTFVYREVAKARRSASEDPTLYSLMEQRKEC